MKVLFSTSKYRKCCEQCLLIHWVFGPVCQGCENTAALPFQNNPWHREALTSPHKHACIASECFPHLRSGRREERGVNKIDGS